MLPAQLPHGPQHVLKKKRNVRLINTFYKNKKKKKNYKLMWHNMIGYKINSNFEKPNHIVPHQFVKVFFVKYVCKPSIFLKNNNIICL
jgi:hypothetical protein